MPTMERLVLSQVCLLFHHKRIIQWADGESNSRHTILSGLVDQPDRFSPFLTCGPAENRTQKWEIYKISWNNQFHKPFFLVPDTGSAPVIFLRVKQMSSLADSSAIISQYPHKESNLIPLRVKQVPYHLALRAFSVATKRIELFPNIRMKDGLYLRLSPFSLPFRIRT